MVDNIKDVFIILAKYNKITNFEILEILKDIKNEKLTDDVNSYYGSIMGILNHQLLADINWLRALGENILELNIILSDLERFPSNRSSLNELHWPKLDDNKNARLKLDELLEHVVNSIPLLNKLAS